MFMYGDSLAFDAADQLEFWLPLGGMVDLDLATMPGTALCDWLPSMRAVARTTRPAAVIVALTGNAFTPCMRDLAGNPLAGQLRAERYLNDAREVTRIFGAQTTVLFVGWPPPRGDERGATADQIRDVYRTVAREAQNAVYVDASEYLVDATGSYTRTRPCLMFEPCGPNGLNVVRAPDGVHFCPVARESAHCPVWSSGAMRYSLSISRVLRDSLGGPTSPSRQEPRVAQPVRGVTRLGR